VEFKERLAWVNGRLEKLEHKRNSFWAKLRHWLT
jgi:hypothetical protein